MDQGVFVVAFVVSALAGLAALLRGGGDVTRAKVVSALLNSGLLGLAIALLYYTHFKDNLYFLLGACVLTGLAGMTALDFVLEVIKKGGFSIQVGKDKINLGEDNDERMPDQGKK